MKRIVLAICAFVFVTAGHAQKNVPISDTIYSSADSGRTLKVSSANRYSYNSNCLDTLHEFAYLSNYPDPQLGFDLFSYNADSTVHTTIRGYLDTLTHTKVNQSRTTTSYLPGKHPDTAISEIWKNGMWKPLSRDVYKYDSMKYLISSKNERWDTLFQAYKNNSQHLTSYYFLPKSERNEYQDWDEMTSSWKQNFVLWYTYNDSDYASGNSYREDDEYGKVFDTASYYYHANNILDSTIIVDSSSYGSQPVTVRGYKVYFTYDMASKVSQVISYSTIDNRLIEITKTSHYYDTTNSFYSDSSTVRGLDLVTQQDLGLRSTYIYRHRDNTDGTPAEIITFGYDTQGYSDYHRTVYHYASCQSLLPVTLLSFAGEVRNADGLLHWSAVNEDNALNYTVQRSTDGVHFATIGKVAARGSTLESKYDYTDRQINLLQSPKVFYRLAQMDKNGTITYTSIVTLYVNTGKLLVTLSPNPVQNMLTVYTPFAIAKATLQIADINGRQVYNASHSLVAGGRVFLNMSTYAKGTYVVTIQSAGNKQVFKVVK